jgi:hypothetical protein
MLKYFLRVLLHAYHVFGLGQGWQGQWCFDCLGLRRFVVVVMLPHANLFMCVPLGLAMSAMVVAWRYILQRLILMAFLLVLFCLFFP